ncbi:MAG: hypothetical protein KC503_07085 [Myxococcales bacterium]|nr:hypothetical protein [Myxococcales bacterium]
MGENKLLYSDRFGDIIDRADDHCVEIRWFDSTSAMSGDDFNDFLSTYASHVERCGRSGALVDAVQFHMDIKKMSMGWRDEHIVPRYNKAGLTKFAFIMPAGMPAIGKAPAREGPADYPTAYFATRAEALAWLKG